MNSRERQLILEDLREAIETAERELLKRPTYNHDRDAIIWAALWNTQEAKRKLELLEAAAV